MGGRNNQMVGGAPAVSIRARVAARLLACVVRGGRRVPAAAAAATWLCVAAVLLAGCGSAGQARPGAGRSAVTSGAWRADTSGTRQRLYAVACLSALRCEAVGAAGTIVSTGDGGTAWRAQANPLQGSSKILYRIACVAPSSCYVIARPDTILVTHDGGATWSSHVLSLAGAGTGLTSQACPPGPAGAVGGQLCRLGLLDIACVSASICYAVATGPAGYFYSPIPVPGQAGRPNAIWMTRDGGASWTRQPIPPGVGCVEGDCGSELFPYPLEWVSCLSIGLCRAGGGYFVGGNSGIIYAVLASARPGAPWTMLTCTQPPAPCLKALATAQPTPAGAAFSPDAGVCPTSVRCYGVSGMTGNGVNWSADGGKYWLGGPSGASSVRNAIACPAARTCYTAGNQGTITRTANGTAFVADGHPTTRDLYGITCADAVTCYAVGDGGTIVARQ
jgi:Photosynthesis system II assembly factor YCF48